MHKNFTNLHRLHFPEFALSVSLTLFFKGFDNKLQTSQYFIVEYFTLSLGRMRLFSCISTVSLSHKIFSIDKIIFSNTVHIQIFSIKRVRIQSRNRLHWFIHLFSRLSSRMILSSLYIFLTVTEVYHIPRNYTNYVPSLVNFHKVNIFV